MDVGCGDVSGHWSTLSTWTDTGNAEWRAAKPEVVATRILY
jgi:hypothetical protein